MMIQQNHLLNDKVFDWRIFLRVVLNLNQEYNILGEIILLECAELNTLINRLLYPDKVKTEPGVSIKVEWELVHVSFEKKTNFSFCCFCLNSFD